MQYNPQYCTIVVRNTDGSGYLRQFETLAEAKDAYASISASGASVYLYQPPTKSLADGDASAPPPPPISSNESEVVESGVTRSPFAFTSIDNIAVQTMSKVGCVVGKVTDADGQEVFASIYPRYIFQENGVTVDEKLGEMNTNGCYLPNGFKIERTSNQNVYSQVQVLNSLDYGGGVYGPYYEVWSLLGWSREYVIANGDGTTRVDNTIGIPHTTPQGGFDKIEWEFYQNGDTPYKLTSDINFSNWVKVGQPIPNGRYLVTYKVPPSDDIHSGYWIASIINAETSPKVKWVFEPVEPDQPPPPPCSVTRKTTNPITGAQEDDCDPDVIYPFSVEENCEPPVTVIIEGQSVTLGTNTKKGMDNGYGNVVWGPCSGMIYVPNGTLVLSGTDLNYFSDGQGSVYSESKNPNSCDPDGTLISQTTEPILVQIGIDSYQVGYHYENTVANGNCGTRLELGTEYISNGTYITQFEGSNYYSNGTGGVYSCQESGTLISSFQNPALIMITQIDTMAQVGTYPSNTYADGSCGQYSTDGDITYYSSGTQIASGGGYNFFSNGEGGYYSEQITCDAYGTYLSGTSSDLTVYISEIGSSYTAGSYSESTYADGNCGTYTESSNSWYMSGTQIASDSSNNYFSDGNSGYYYEPISNNCDAYGTYVSGNNSDATIYISEIGSNYTAGSNYESTYADGNCGTYTESGTSWYSYGTYITNGNGYNFYSDGNGGYYSESDGSGGGSSCDAYGTYINGDSQTNYTYISELEGNYENGYSYNSTYADGNCGTYTESGTYYKPYGEVIAYSNDNMQSYNSDRNGSYYVNNL